MIVSIHQPAYLPWIGYFNKIINSDIFVYLDTVQFQKNSFQNRNKIRTSNGCIWLTIPVITKKKLFSLQIKDLSIDNSQNWKKKHLNSIKMNYSKSLNYKSIMKDLEPFYMKEEDNFSKFCYEMLIWFLKKLNIKTKIIKASDLPPIDKNKNDLILEICKHLKAKTYISGILGKDYIKVSEFEKKNIKIKFQNFNHPIYDQVYKDFIPNMGIVDLIMNEKNSLKKIK